MGFSSSDEVLSVSATRPRRLRVARSTMPIRTLSVTSRAVSRVSCVADMV